MKRALSFLLIVAIAALLSSCGVKEAVQRGTWDVLNAATGQEISYDPGEIRESHTGITPSGKQRPLARLEGDNYEERLYNEWLNAPEEGYVWTITLDDVDVIDVLGLCTATYTAHLSASHIGPDMYGSYFGEFGFEYSADLSGMEALFTYQGGSMDSDTDGWFKNDRFVFSMGEYDPEDEELLVSLINSNSEDEAYSETEKAYVDAMLASIYNLDNEEAFEKEEVPEAMAWNYDIPMTEGDRSHFINMSGILGGLVNASGSVDESGHAVGHASTPFGSSSESEDYVNEMPHTIKVYPNGQVVMTIYSSTGGPVTTKLYGTIEKIPVEDTIVPNK